MKATLLLSPLCPTTIPHASTSPTYTNNSIDIISSTLPTQTTDSNYAHSLPLDNPSPPLSTPPTTPDPDHTLAHPPSPSSPDIVPRTRVATITPSSNTTTASRPSRNTSPPPNFWRGACISSSPTTTQNGSPPTFLNSSSRTTAVHRKIQLARQAAIRNR